METGWRISLDRERPHDDSVTTPEELYTATRVALICAALESPDLLAAAAGAARFPDGYGIGFDERVVEYPWFAARKPLGRTLDAGSTLNHAYVLDRVQPLVSDLHILSFQPEASAHTDRGISYVYADLRELPFRDDLYDTVACLSTLEHVGMDNTMYGGAPRAANPRRECQRALTELIRVVAPGGRVLVTVPYGRSTDHGWFRQFGRSDVEELIEWASPSSADVRVFRYAPGGWQVSDLVAASDSVYHDWVNDPTPSASGAVAASAVACIQLTPEAHAGHDPKRQR